MPDKYLPCKFTFEKFFIEREKYKENPLMSNDSKQEFIDQPGCQLRRGSVRLQQLKFFVSQSQDLH
jgi:hypothetical protein